MLPATQSHFNMDGSNDPHYRYQVPALKVKVEGSNKMRKSVLLNLQDISRAIGRPSEYVLKFLSQSCSAASKFEKETGKMYISGVHEEQALQASLRDFIRKTVQCGHCGNPETTCHIEGKKKATTVSLLCKACSRRTELDPSDRFVKFIASHPPSEVQGSVGGVPSDATATRGGIVRRADDDDAPGEKKPHKGKGVCPVCNHKSSKTKCSKCGAPISLAEAGGPHTDVTNVDKALVDPPKLIPKEEPQSAATEPAGAEGPAPEQEPLCLDAWLQSRVPDAKLAPLDKLGVVVGAMAQQVCQACTPPVTKAQPIAVAAQAQPLVQKWISLLDQSCTGVDGAVATDAIVRAVQKSSATALGDTVGAEVLMLGVLLSLRDLVDKVEDDDLVASCKRFPAQSRILKQFVEYIEGCNEEGGDDETE